MKIHIITIFPEVFNSYFSWSIMWKAIEKWILKLYFYKLNDFSTKKTKRIDEKAYWMHWQVISPEPLSEAIEYIFSKCNKKIPVLYMSPKWELLKQEKLENYISNFWKEFIIICGHYEWIDQRIIDIYVDYELSIWEYIISSWELSSMVLIDWLIRLIPWVIWNKLSYEEDSFSKKLNRKKEYPLYTKPDIFMWLEVPKILLSWNHKKIENWKISNLKD
jgi:tRNA (guanine37-N1)-methyltransferase